MHGQEVEEAPIIGRLHSEQWEQCAIASARFREAAPHKLSEIVGGNLAPEKHLAHVEPELVVTVDEAFEQHICNLPPPLPDGANETRRHRPQGFGQILQRHLLIDSTQELLDDVLDLSDVPRPRIVGQRCAGRVVDLQGPPLLTRKYGQ